MMTRKKIIQIVLGLVLVLILGVGSCLRTPKILNPAYGNMTMGTGYSIKLTGKATQKELQALSQKINFVLAGINRQMSTWDPDSEISQFNHSSSTEPFACSEPFAEVVRHSLELAESTGGAFDPTLQPLLNLWGFGSEGEERRVPTDAAIAETLKKTGWRKLSVHAGTVIQKSEPELSLALGAIAKGYGVDAIAAILKDSGYKNWFVEIGGEIAVMGRNPDGVPWRIGIQQPSTNPMDESLQGMLNLSGGTIATSGDYRNYIEENGRIYSHILDPRTGRAVHSETASVTVFAPRCIAADGIATALYVMGADEGLRWVEAQADIEAMFLVRGDGGEINEIFSSGFEQATVYTPSY